jgi:hypothetical protein
MNYKSEEVGYAHEIINLSLKKAKDALNRVYSKETKLLAFLVLKVTDKIPKGYEIQIDKNEDTELKVLYYICTDLRFLAGVYNDHRKKLKELFQQYLERETTPAFESFKESLEKAIVLHIISKELKEKNLIDKNFITQTLSAFSQDDELSGVLIALQKLDEKPLSELEVDDIIGKIHKTTNSTLLPISTYLTFKLAMKSKEHKNKLLLEHFFLLKNLAQNFNITSEWENVDDTSLKKLFTTSILLYFCGYDTTLRIPHSEKLNYLKNMMSLPPFILEFERAYQECTTSRLLRGVPLQLWIISLINAISILLSLLHYEIYSPATLNFYVINFNLPRIPLFGIVSVLLSFYITMKLYKLKDQIIKKMRV